MRTSVLPRMIFSAMALFYCLISTAQEKLPVSFSFEPLRISESEVMLKMKVALEPGVKFYSINGSSEDAPVSSVVFDSVFHNRLQGELTEKGTLVTAVDPLLNTTVNYFSDSVEWQQVIKAAVSDSFLLKGAISYMYRNGDEYVPGEQPFKIFIQPEAVAATRETRGMADQQSLWWIFFTAFAGGLLALLTPCVYSMIPVTVSFFTKRSSSRGEGIRNALWYAASIVLIFTLLGFLITVIFGPAALNNLATNWIANLIFFAIFLVFGISFLGAFEIALPSSWANKADTRSGVGSFAGIFFMALTLVLVSFSCTGPIIGNLLVLAARGSYYGPLVGMAGFSIALALPFALFAFFPARLNMLGKAGGWLNAVKVTLGFLELALALKFLSNADLARGWRLLDREVFISLWVVIFLLLGIYLLGKLKFRHDDQLPFNDFGLPHLSVTRLFFAMSSLVFAVYMVPGLFGAPLKGISAFLPPMGTQDFTGAGISAHSKMSIPAVGSETSLLPMKYTAEMKMYEPEVVTKFGMVTFFDYDEALQAAREVNKPLMIDFTGINCVNCRKMEGEVWSDPQVMKRLKEDFVIVSLYVDVHHIDLQQHEQYFSDALQTRVETLGDKNTDFQVSRFKANSQPYYFFLDANEKPLAEEGYGYDPDVNKFITHLDQVKKVYGNN